MLKHSHHDGFIKAAKNEYETIKKRDTWLPTVIDDVPAAYKENVLPLI
jgi:hypothetical protein